MPPALTVVVVAYRMARELPRTLHSLSPAHQRGIAADAYEVVVVDNGSPDPVDGAAAAAAFEAAGGGQLRALRLDPAPASPARAANAGIAAAEGEVVGLIVDGARMASPGLLAGVVQACRLAERPVVATLGWHLGPVRHMDAAEAGYDQSVEDALLAELDWTADGYRLFERSVLAGSSGRGWFGPMGESSALFLPKALWEELGGLDEAFALPGGGLVNHDLYRRACALAGAQLVVLLGEGTFHQYHGGAATSRRFGWDEMHADYVRLRGGAYQPPANAPVYVGALPPAALDHVAESARLAQAARERAARAGRR
jgi:hypothetical protein